MAKHKKVVAIPLPETTTTQLAVPEVVTPRQRLLKQLIIEQEQLRATFRKRRESWRGLRDAVHALGFELGDLDGINSRRKEAPLTLRLVDALRELVAISKRDGNLTDPEIAEFFVPDDTDYKRHARWVHDHNERIAKHSQALRDLKRAIAAAGRP